MLLQAPGNQARVVGNLQQPFLKVCNGENDIHVSDHRDNSHGRFKATESESTG